MLPFSRAATLIALEQTAYESAERTTPRIMIFLSGISTKSRYCHRVDRRCLKFFEKKKKKKEMKISLVFLHRLFSCTAVLWTPSALNTGINQRNGKLRLVWSYKDIYGTIFITFVEFLRRKTEFLFRSWSHCLTLHFIFNRCSFICEYLKNLNWSILSFSNFWISLFKCLLIFNFLSY